MRRMALFVALALLPSPVAVAQTPGGDARRARERALEEARELAARAGSLEDRFRAANQDADAAAARLIDAYRRHLAIRGRLAAARDRLSQQAGAAYERGPGAFLNVLLGTDSIEEYLYADELMARTLFEGIGAAHDLLIDAEASRTRLRSLEKRRRDLSRREQDLALLLAETRAAELQAREAARAAGLRLAELAAARARTESAAARRLVRVRTIAALANQAELLDLLGPSGGRTCELPPGLRTTGRSFRGVASWYGWDFAGDATATGAAFDPRLFTAAHRTLPLPTFLRIRTGGSCAVVLVNDRGPYVEGRVLDVSLAVARYLGFEGSGTAQIEAEVLAPTGAG